jgi:RHS repeat-associated protein
LGGVAGNRQFLTKEQDRTGFIYFGARYYDPRIGRFLTPDPSGMTDGPNLYLYCLNDPVNAVDLWGLCKDKKEPWWKLNTQHDEVVPMPGESWESYYERFKQAYGTQMAISDALGAWGLKSVVTTGALWGVTSGGEALTSHITQRTLTTIGGKGFMYIRGWPQTMYLRQASSGFMAAGKISGIITVGATAYSAGLRLRAWIIWKITTSVYSDGE